MRIEDIASFKTKLRSVQDDFDKLQDRTIGVVSLDKRFGLLDDKVSAINKVLTSILQRENAVLSIGAKYQRCLKGEGICPISANEIAVAENVINALNKVENAIKVVSVAYESLQMKIRNGQKQRAELERKLSVEAERDRAERVTAAATQKILKQPNLGNLGELLTDGDIQTYYKSEESE